MSSDDFMLGTTIKIFTAFLVLGGIGLFALGAWLF